LRYGEGFVLLVKGETVLQGKFDRLIYIEECYRMEINVEKTKIMRLPKQTFYYRI
jgi:hypothetical protein